MKQHITLIVIIFIELSITAFVLVANRLSLKAIQNIDSENCIGYNKKKHTFGLELALIGFSLIITSFSFFGSNYKIEYYSIFDINPMLMASFTIVFYLLFLFITVFYKNKYLAINNKPEDEIGILKKMNSILKNYFPLVLHNFIGFIMFSISSIILLNQGIQFINIIKIIF